MKVFGPRRPAAVCLDLDGTTLDGEQKLAPRTKAAILAARAAGIRVIIATGRPSYSTQRYVDELGAAVVCVVFNGAAVARLRPFGAPRLAPCDGLGGSRARAALRVGLALDCCVSLVLASRAVAVARAPRHVALLERFVDLEGSAQEVVEDGDAYCDDAIKVLALCGGDPAAVAAEAAALLGEGSGVVVVPAEVHVEFLAAGVTKASALAKLLSASELRRTVAFGDSWNDVEMLEAAGEGVAVANAREGVKARADRVSPWRHDEDGVARELEGRKRAIQRRFNVGFLEAISERKASAL